MGMHVTRYIRYIYIIFTAFFVTYAAPTYAADEGACTVVNGEITDDPTTTDDYHYCFPDFQSARVNFYDILVCPKEPSLSTYLDECTSLYSDADGQFVELAKGQQFAMPSSGPISIMPGTYTHLAMVIEPKLYHKFELKFDGNRMGVNNSVGEYCWTISGESWKFGYQYTLSNVECGTQADMLANATFSTEKAMRCKSGQLKTVIPFGWNASNTKYASAASVGSDKKTAISGHNDPCPSSPSAVPTINYNVNFQRLATPLVITPSTSTIDFYFDPTEAGLLKMMSPGEGTGGSLCPGAPNTVPCIATIRSKAPEFIITAR